MFNNRAKVTEFVEKTFAQQRLLVLGDIILDRYLWGAVSRISPEAPVPVVKLLRETETAGGAGNVALNVAGLGLQVSLCGFAGTDIEGDRLTRLLNDAGVKTDGIMRIGRPTIAKTRVIGEVPFSTRRQQILRLDMEDVSAPGKRDIQALLDAVKRELDTGVGVIILSDYAKGTLSKDLCQRVIATAKARGIPVLVDPKGHDYSKYAGATAVSPNRSELSEVSRVPSGDLDRLMAAGQVLCKDLGLDFVLLTLSELGMALVKPDMVKRVPAIGREVFDVSGAGDASIATLAAGIAAGLDLEDVVSLANLAGGVVVGKVGTTPITRRELAAAILTEQAMEQSDKVTTTDDLCARVAQWKAKGERVAFTNGCFDLLHIGHVTYLENARREGDRLIVALNTDRSVHAVKGEGRPLIPQDERARMLAALASVDAVVLFDDDTPLELIKAVRPDVLVKGSNYREDQIDGAKEVRSWGGNVVIIPVVEGYSVPGVFPSPGTGRPGQAI